MLVLISQLGKESHRLKYSNSWFFRCGFVPRDREFKDTLSDDGKHDRGAEWTSPFLLLMSIPAYCWNIFAISHFSQINWKLIFQLLGTKRIQGIVKVCFPSKYENGFSLHMYLCLCTPRAPKVLRYRALTGLYLILGVKRCKVSRLIHLKPAG